jgi:hypothetical protein
MNIHYFQRYHSKENVATANAMLLLSRLYLYSPTKFYMVLSEILQENANVELTFKIQDKIKDGNIPDATITQASFKIVVETKITSHFDRKQLEGHLESFNNETYQILLTLDPKPFSEKWEEDFHKELLEISKDGVHNIEHKHLTFEGLIKLVSEVLDQRDYEMNDIVEDFREFCSSSNLLSSSWKTMCVRTAGTTIDTNLKLNLYYDGADKGYTAFDYLGLYAKKTVMAVGKVTDIITAVFENGELIYTVENGTLTQQMKKSIQTAIEDAKNYSYRLSETPERYFFVNKFYQTEYKKTSPGSLMSKKYFDLCEILGVKKLPETVEIAELLKNKTWE